MKKEIQFIFKKWTKLGYINSRIFMLGKNRTS